MPRAGAALNYMTVADQTVSGPHPFAGTPQLFLSTTRSTFLDQAHPERFWNPLLVTGERRGSDAGPTPDAARRDRQRRGTKAKEITINDCHSENSVF